MTLKKYYFFSNFFRESNSGKREENADPHLEAFFRRLEKNQAKIGISRLKNHHTRKLNEHLNKTKIVRQSNRLVADEAIENNRQGSSLRLVINKP